MLRENRYRPHTEIQINTGRPFQALGILECFNIMRDDMELMKLNFNY
ncbi:Protein of unknown function, partial [Gryllus bimaculatus]